MKHFFSWSKFKISKTYVIIVGLTATIWFLIRVIPKPTRAKYPCMQAAAPLMSSFIIYLIGISASMFSYKKFKELFKSSRYSLASVFLVLSIVSFFTMYLIDSKESFANILRKTDNTFPVSSNDPIGEAKGLFPGRVVWVHDKDATTESFYPDEGSGDWWYSDDNADEAVIKNMLFTAIRQYTNEYDIVKAWDILFKSHNSKKGKGEVGYTAGEKIAIKLNLTNQCCSNEARMDATPQLVNALLFELTVNAGIPAGDITIGDPYREFRSEYIDLVASKYPGVNYVDGSGFGNGVDKTVASSTAVLKFSDNNFESTLPQHYLDAEYFINMPCLKTHDVGGITLIAKNHQGSYLPVGDDPAGQSAFDMHYSLVGQSTGTGKYRHIVDYMGHEQTGGKALIYIIDGIWGGENWEGWIKKFKSAPFNNDYPNSIFIGQDPVALESVCFDVLFEEYVQDPSKEDYPIRYKEEIADYLSQMASSDYWPSGISYDPEGDGSNIGSLGVFEHWNNATDRKYTRNLGTGNGIELKYSGVILSKKDRGSIEIHSASPNPFSDQTTIKKPNAVSNNAIVNIFSLDGKLIKTLPFISSDVVYWDGSSEVNSYVNNGIYIYKIVDKQSNQVYTGKVILEK